MLSRRLFLAGLAVLAALGSAGCDGGNFPDAAVPDAPALGRVSLAWSLTDLAGQPVTCDQVGGKTVALELRNQAGVSGVAASFSCGNSPSETQDLVAGTYNVSFRLNGNDGTIATAPDQIGVIVAAGPTTVLAPITFAIDAQGGLVLSFAAPPRSSNCKLPAMDGANITGTSLTLVDARGSCAPVTFTRSRGSTPIGTYTVNCSAPPTDACIETDETLRIDRMPSGPYTVHVRGKTSGVDCWKNDDAIAVPSRGKVLTQRLNLAHQDVPGC